mmetsp:Transcript_28188/g.31688  ORF Transcript_28188/g.31688 Transcript_28188/m.31688 type:complete len:94 (-) Transcript_28188:311-592(-)
MKFESINIRSALGTFHSTSQSPWTNIIYNQMRRKKEEEGRSSLCTVEAERQKKEKSVVNAWCGKPDLKHHRIGRSRRRRRSKKDFVFRLSYQD